MFKKSIYNDNVMSAKNLKSLTTFRKIIIGVLNVACIYFLIMFSIMFSVYSAFGISLGGIPFGVWLVLTLLNACIILLLLACAMTNLVMMIKLQRNPYDEKAIEIQKKVKKSFKILIISHICWFILTYIIFILLSNH